MGEVGRGLYAPELFVLFVYLPWNILCMILSRFASALCTELDPVELATTLKYAAAMILSSSSFITRKRRRRRKVGNLKRREVTLAFVLSRTEAGPSIPAVVLLPRSRQFPKNEAE
jgi:hypothetical protein